MTLIKKLKRWVPTLPQKKLKENHPTPQNTPYLMIGGETGVRKLANRFYDHMESSPEAAALLAIHPKPLDSIRQRFFEYLSGWLGGPALFEQQYGHPRLRARHLPYQITPQLKQQWMHCMTLALAEVVENRALRDGLHQSFDQLAQHMVNCPNASS